MTYYKLLEIDPTVEDNPVGSYGTKWLNFMSEHHPDLVTEMIGNKTLADVARSVDDTAWNYRELLDAQYMKANPRPKTFEEIVSWERTRAYYTDGEVMRDKVLIPLTRA
jgi:hypothetical protein